MQSINATELKNRLGPALARARLGPVAILRHGKVVAYLVPPTAPHAKAAAAPSAMRASLGRRAEERLVRLCASGDLRPSRWERAGNPALLAGVATMLASQPEFDRVRLLALAERLQPGMSRADEFGKWLLASPLRPSRFLPMVKAERARRSQ